MAIVVNDNTFEEIVLKSELPAMVDFGAKWCGPCRALEPYVEQVAAEYEGKAIVVKADVEQCPDISGKYGIRNIPAIMFFKEGKWLKDKTLTGLVPKATLTKTLDELL